MTQNHQANEFTREMIEAGLKLTDRDILRGRFIINSGGWPQSDGRRPAQEHFLAEILADPDKAAVFLASSPQIANPDASFNCGQMANGPPWPFPACTSILPESDPPLAGAGEDGFPLLLDFFGRSAALVAGAAISGAAALDESFLYTHTFDGRPIKADDIAYFGINPQSIVLTRQANRVLVLGFVRDSTIMGMNPGLSRLRPNTGWLDWVGQIEAVEQVAAIIRAQGYLALPSAGGLLMADHHGVMAGLGELGRQGLLITPEYGPNLRLFTIITDFPFTIGQPQIFGIADYCETCQRCINECPARAIAEGHRQPGLFQWPVNRQACFDNWREKKDPCRKCIEICPYTREPLVGGRAPA